MSITVLQLMAKVGIDTKEAEAGLAAVSGAGDVMSKGLLLGAGAAAVGVAAIGVASLKMAGDFQKASETLVTGAGESQSNLGMVQNGILQMARDTGTSTSQLISGMFMIESAGYHGAAGLNILQTAAEGAKVGNADLGTTADALTTIMKDFPNTTNGVSGAMNTLIATVASGKTHMQDLAGSLSTVLPTAASAGIGLNSVMGAMATMTGEGVDAANAATYLRQLMISLSAPSKQAADALGSVGLTTQQVSDAMHKSLPDALQLIQDHLQAAGIKQGSDKWISMMKDIAGGSRQMQGILDLTGGHMKDFINNTNNIGDAATKGGKSVTGWATVQGEFNQQVDRAKEVAETLMISLGQHLLPAGTALFGFLADKAIPTLVNFVTWISGSSQSATVFKAMLAGLAIAVIASLVPAFVAWAISAGAAAIATIAATWPILAIGAAIGIAILVIKAIIDHFGGLQAVMKDLQTGWYLLGQTIGDIWSGIQTAVIGGINNVIIGIDQFIRALDSVHITLPGGATVGFNIGLIPLIGGAGGGTSNAGGGSIRSGHVKMMAAGGDLLSGSAIVGEAGPELLTALGSGGARVTPLPTGLSGGGASGAPAQQTIIVQLDGQVLARSVVKHAPSQIRLITGRRDI